MKKPEILGANLIACAIACGPAAAVWVSAGAAAKTGGMVAVAAICNAPVCGILLAGGMSS